MAKILPGPLVGDIRNRLGGQVFARNHHGAYVRNFTEPDQTLTPRRSVVQESFAAASTLWNSGLSDDQRAAWRAYALKYENTASPIGSKRMAGRITFLRINQRLGLYLAPLLTDPPSNKRVQQISQLELAADADAQTLDLSFAPSPVPADHAMVIFATPSLNLGRTFSANAQKFLLYLDAGITSPTSIAAAWIAREGAIPPGGKIFARARLLNTVNGAYSVNQVAQAITTGTGDAMLYLRTVIPHADILSLPTTPYPLLAAPPSGKVQVLHQAILTAYCPTNYNNIGAFCNLQVGYNTPATGSAFNDPLAGNLITQLLAPAATEPWKLTILPYQFNSVEWGSTVTSGEVQRSVCDGIALSLRAANYDALYNDLGNFTDGDNPNTLTVDLFYSQIDS